MPKKLGYVGLGAMGLPYAGHLSAAGYDVTAYNRSDRPYEAARRAGMTIAGSLEECVAAADILFTCLPSPDIVETVYDRISKPGLICCDNSTVGYQQAKELQARLASRGVGYVECPILGGAREAETAQTFLIVSGADADVGAVIPIALSGARGYRHVGGPGTASLVKTVQNGLGHVQMAAIAEALTIIAKANVRLDEFIDVVSEGGGMAGTPLFRKKAPHMRELPAATGSKLAIAAKDAKFAAELAHGLGVPAPLITEASAIYQEGVRAGLGEQDFAAIIRVLENRAGVSVSRKRQAG